MQLRRQEWGWQLAVARRPISQADRVDLPAWVHSWDVSAAVRDAFSNRIVGWRCSDRCDTDLILGALEYGIWSRDVRQGGRPVPDANEATSTA